MTNQQGAPEALPDPSPDQLRAIARTARNSSGSASDDCGPLAYVLHGWRAAAIALRAQQAALVEAQQSAPSAAPAVSDEDEALDLLATLFDAWENGTPCYEEPESSDGFLGYAFRLDDEVFHRCADLLNRRRGKQPSPTPQADSQPAKVELFNPLEGGNLETELQMAAVINLRDSQPAPVRDYPPLPKAVRASVVFGAHEAVACLCCRRCSTTHLICG